MSETFTTMHHVLMDIADYFRECKSNASPGSAAEKRFNVYVSAITDADRMLKSKEPRVLTYEETDAIAHQTEETAIYLERKSDKSLYAAIAGDTQGRVPNISWLGEKRNYLSEYGKTWRCWSSRPTDEQREAVQWQE